VIPPGQNQSTLLQKATTVYICALAGIDLTTHSSASEDETSLITPVKIVYASDFYRFIVARTIPV
jgi:hypothetical protein